MTILTLKQSETQLNFSFTAKKSNSVQAGLEHTLQLLDQHIIGALPRPTWRKAAALLAIGVGIYSLNSNESAASSISKPMSTVTSTSGGRVVASVMLSRPRYEVLELGAVKSKQVDFGRLAGQNFGTDLNAKYAGVSGHAPKSAKVNYLSNLGRLYLQKIAWKEVSPATFKAIPIILDRYKERRTLTNLSTYTSDINQRVMEAHAGLDMDGLCVRLRLDRPGETAGCELFKQIAPKITGEHLVAYSMTEIMPRQRDGTFNARLYNHLLQTGGVEYIGSIPALYDKYLSLGGWQFTSFAVRDDASGAEGASLVSRFADDSHKIPGSVMKLVREDHDRAAYYFSLYNVGRLIGCSKTFKGNDVQFKCASKKERAAFERLIASPRGVDQVAQYMAIAHHLPGPARDRTRAWLSKGAKGSLRDHLGPKLTTYAIKSHYNLKGLRKFLSETAGTAS